MEIVESIRNQLDGLKELGRYRKLEKEHGVSVSHNDYLGLSTHPEIIEAGVLALRSHGAGSRGSRLLGGNTSQCEETESAIAKFFGSPSALFFSSGYLANLAVIQALSPHVSCLYSDEKNHASLVDAIRLSHKERRIVPHGRWEEVKEGRALVISETLFSMDGDWLDLDCLQRFPKDGYLHLDEAHAAGGYRESGKGWATERVDWKSTSVTVTFGKSFGVSGAAVLCNQDLRELLINSARTFIYSTAPGPHVFAMVQKSLEVCESESWRRTELWKRSEDMRRILLLANEVRPAVKVPAGLWEWRSPIISFEVPGDLNALSFSQSMRDLGFDVRAIRYPTVAKGSERLRISVNLASDRERLLELSLRMVDLWKVFS